MFRHIFSKLEGAGASFQLCGLVNSESGNIALSTEPITYCDTCNGQDFDALQFDCPDCFRLTTNYVFTTSGDGDGIYGVWEIATKGKTSGVICLYDSSYHAANQVRQSVEHERLTPLTLELARQAEDALTTTIGRVDVQDSVVVAEVYGQESNASVRVTGLDPGSYVGIAFVEPPEESSGPMGPRPIHTVRAVALIHTPLIEQLNIPDDTDVDWSQHLIGAMSAVVTSHREPVGESVQQVNLVIEQLRSVQSSTPHGKSPVESSPAIDAGQHPAQSFRTPRPRKQHFFCIQCGEKLPSHARFCPACGATAGLE